MFKDYTKFLRKINDKGLAVTLNVHPSDGVRFWEDKYKEFCNKLGIDYTTKKQIEFDICNDEFVNYYFKLLHHPYENDGVSFWWIDWQQGQKTNINGLTPLWALNHYHYLDNARNKRTPLILSRYAGVGSHRYPLGFSGDTFITWETLSFLPEFTSTASNIGYSWWSHDIGGHMRGKKDDELYVRMVELGVFSPINRLHCSNLETMTKEPWYYNNGTGLIVEKYLRLRHKLIPYLYTASWNNNKNGQALIEPLYYYNNNQEAYNYPNEYYFGGQLLVCPITTKKGKGYYSKVKTWIPEGKWTDIFTNEEYVVGSNGKKKTLHRTLENIVVLAKEGGIIPYSLDEGNSVENPHNLQIDVYNGNGEFTLYEDNAHVNKEGTFFTKFVTKKDKNSQVIEITSQGDNSVIPTNRKFRITFKNIYNGIINLYIDGVKKKVNEVNSDNTSLSINFEANREYKIIVDYTYSRLANIIRQAQVVLTEYELDNLTKYQVFNNIRSCTSIKELKNIVKTIQVKELRAKIEEWI